MEQVTSTSPLEEGKGRCKYVPNYRGRLCFILPDALKNEKTEEEGLQKNSQGVASDMKNEDPPQTPLVRGQHSPREAVVWGSSVWNNIGDYRGGNMAHRFSSRK